MSKKIAILTGILVLLLVVTGVVVYWVVFHATPQVQTEEEFIDSSLPPVDDSVAVNLARSKSKDSTVDLEISALAGKFTTICYELSYETEGLIQGVNCGSKPIDVSGEDEFTREVYLGTCSKNTCRAHPGVKKVSVVIEFTDSEGKISQFSKDFQL